MAQSASGKQILAGDEVTILGYATAISGTGPKASVTVADNTGNSFVVLASDCAGPQSEGPAMGRFGKKFSVGDSVAIPGQAQSVGAGVGISQITTKVTSGVSVVHSSASAHAPHKH